jgi:acyl-CoA reductase-like NAD-dependent aldehyde dehydrogenase
MAMSEASVAGVAVDIRHRIGGRRVAPPGTFTDLSPIDEQPLAEVARGGEAEVAAAVSAAGQAFGGAGQSGIGREGGTWSFGFYADAKNTVCAGRGWRPGG